VSTLHQQIPQPYYVPRLPLAAETIITQPQHYSSYAGLVLWLQRLKRVLWGSVFQD
jgi:hypothetical protein